MQFATPCTEIVSAQLNLPATQVEPYPAKLSPVKCGVFTETLSKLAHTSISHLKESIPKIFSLKFKTPSFTLHSADKYISKITDIKNEATLLTQSVRGLSREISFIDHNLHDISGITLNNKLEVENALSSLEEVIERKNRIPSLIKNIEHKLHQFARKCVFFSIEPCTVRSPIITAFSKTEKYLSRIDQEFPEIHSRLSHALKTFETNNAQKDSLKQAKTNLFADGTSLTAVATSGDLNKNFGSTTITENLNTEIGEYLSFTPLQPDSKEIPNTTTLTSSDQATPQVTYSLDPNCVDAVFGTTYTWSEWGSNNNFSSSLRHHATPSHAINLHTVNTTINSVMSSEAYFSSY